MAKFSMDSKVGDLIKDPAACAVLDSYLPPWSTTNPQIKVAYSMTLKEVASFPQAGISKEKLQEIDQKLHALG